VEAQAGEPAGARTVSLPELGQRLLASRLALPVILVLTFAIFAPSLDDWFRSDDFWWLRASQDTPIGEYTIEALDYRAADPVPEFIFYRPLYMISFRLSYEVFGMHAVGYHALNVALHMAAVALVWFIARRLVSSPALASALTLVFALHPSYTETVTWISRGNALMMMVAYLGTILCFLQYMDGGRRSLLYYGGSVLAFTAAILYHPNALSLVVLLPAYVFLIARRPVEALRVRSWLPFVPFIVLGIAWALIQNWVREEYGLAETFKVGFHQYSNYGQYLGYALFPVLPSDWARFDLPVEWRTLLQGVASVVVIGLALLLLARRAWPYIGVFAVWWFMTALFFNTTIIITQAVPAQLYMPGASVALFFVVAWLWAAALLEEEAPKAREIAPRLAPWFLSALLVIMIGLDLSHLSDDERSGIENERFVATLREDVPALEPGAMLYVTNPPFNLRVFNSDALSAAVGLYYGDVEARAVSIQELPEIEAQLGPNDVIYQYQPVE